jgi:hypothetical protein
MPPSKGCEYMLSIGIKFEPLLQIQVIPGSPDSNDFDHCRLFCPLTRTPPLSVTEVMVGVRSSLFVFQMRLPNIAITC